MRRAAKYGNKKTAFGGIVFDSKKEAERFLLLSARQQAGEISLLARQVSVPIIPTSEDEKMSVYKADFAYKERGVLVLEDVKSAVTRKLPAYILKRKLVKALYVEKTMSADFSDNIKYEEKHKALLAMDAVEFREV